MDDSVHSSLVRLMRDLQRQDEIFRAAQERLPMFERIQADVRIAQEAQAHYNAVRKLAEIRGGAEGTEGIAREARRLAESVLAQGAAGSDRFLVELLATQERLAAPITASLSSFAMVDALSRAYAAAIQHHALGTPATAFDSYDALRDTAVRTASMRAAIEASVAQGEQSAETTRAVEQLTVLTDASTKLWNSFAAQPETLLHLPERFREVPVVQLYGATESTALFVVEEEDIVEIEAPPGLIAEEAPEIEERLSGIDPGLAVAYRGAVEAFHRQGTDYVRHVSTSLRELFDHLIDALAPEASVTAWSNDPRNYQNGELTRKARLGYVFRGLVGTPDYVKVVNGEIDHVLQNFYPLNTGVHKLRPDLERDHLRIQLRRCEYDIITILDAWETSGRRES